MRRWSQCLLHCVAGKLPERNRWGTGCLLDEEKTVDDGLAFEQGPTRVVALNPRRQRMFFLEPGYVAENEA